MCENLTSKVIWHKDCWRQLYDLTYLPCRFGQYDYKINGDNSNSNYNDNNRHNNDSNNGNSENKNKNIHNGNIHFCNS